jgi:signal peptidase II
MTAFVVALILVPLLDQAVTAAVLHWLPDGSIPLGRIGQVRVVRTQIWMRRAPVHLRLVVMWMLWIFAACVLAILCALVPAMGWFSGLLLGGALSHAIETSLRGSICDYVCLRFWPAFDMADVAVTAGACGMVAELFMAIRA